MKKKMYFIYFFVLLVYNTLWYSIQYGFLDKTPVMLDWFVCIGILFLAALGTNQVNAGMCTAQYISIILLYTYFLTCFGVSPTFPLSDWSWLPTNFHTMEVSKRLEVSWKFVGNRNDFHDLERTRFFQWCTGRSMTSNYCGICWISGKSLRLVGSRHPNQGRVEVYKNGRWGTVCSNYWRTEEAKVVCRELGLPQATAALSKAVFPSGNTSTLMRLDYCIGTESSLFNCTHEIAIHSQYCGRSYQEVGVVCGKAGGNGLYTDVSIFLTALSWSPKMFGTEACIFGQVVSVGYHNKNLTCFKSLALLSERFWNSLDNHETLILSRDFEVNLGCFHLSKRKIKTVCETETAMVQMEQFKLFF